MKVQKLRDMTDDELNAERVELKRALFNLRLKKAIGQLEKPHTLRETKHAVAKAETVLRERIAERGGETD